MGPIGFLLLIVFLSFVDYTQRPILLAVIYAFTNSIFLFILGKGFGIIVSSFLIALIFFSAFFYFYHITSGVSRFVVLVIFIGLLFLSFFMKII